MCTVKDRTHASDTIGVDSGDLQILPTQCNSNDNNTFYHVMASKKNDIQQACLRAFQKKRDELVCTFFMVWLKISVLLMLLECVYR